jgi:hypothetical protein
MSYLSHLIVLLVWVVTSPALAVELRWNPHEIEKVFYKAAAEIDITDKLGDLEPQRWIADPNEFDKILERLKRLPLKEEYMHYRSRQKSLDNGRIIRVQMVGVPIEFEGEAANERDAELRERVAVLTNAIMLQGDMDLFGDSANLTFYRSPKERNIMTQLFYLPRSDAAIGDHWRLPIRLLGLGPGFFAQETSSHNQITLAALRSSPAGTVAELRYLVSEKAAGYGERLAGSKLGRQPFDLNITLFGYGEFLVEQGHWLRLVTVIDYAGNGVTKLHKQQLFALELEK